MGLKETVVFSKQVVNSRWFVLFVCFVIMAFTGGTYIFGIYSSAIKTALNYDQQTLDTLGFFKDLGANVGIISGLLYEVAPPWVVLAMGGVMNIVGFMMVWLSVTGHIATPKKWLMFLYITVGSNSQTFTNTAAVITSVKNFPHSRGMVLGLLKGFAGLSGAIFTQIYHATYGNDPRSLILLIGWLPCVVSFGSMLLVRLIKSDEEKNEVRNFYKFLYIALALAAFLMVAIILENHVRFPDIGYKIVTTVIAFFLSVPLAVVVKGEFVKFLAKKRELALVQINVDQPKDVKETNDPEGTGSAMEVPKSFGLKLKALYSWFLRAPSSVSEEFKKLGLRGIHTKYIKAPVRGENYTILQALLSLDMWILFLGAICGIGAALTAIDNMGQIGSALGFSPVDVSTFVSLVSIWNFLGRVVAGFFSEFLLKNYSFPRPLILTTVLAISCVGHLFIAFAIPGSLYVASIVIGFCFGAQWPVIFAIISELFGLKHYSTFYNLVGSASPLGTYILSVRVAGYLYDLEARKQQAHSALDLTIKASSPASAPHRNELTCTGVSCFRETFIIMAIVSVVGSIICGWLVMRTKDFYKGDIYAKYQTKDVQCTEEENNDQQAASKT